MLGESKFMLAYFFISNVILSTTMMFVFVSILKVVAVQYFLCCYYRIAGRADMPEKRVESLGKHVWTQTCKKTKQGNINIKIILHLLSIYKICHI
jgi:hypothetical protein